MVDGILYVSDWDGSRVKIIKMVDDETDMRW